MSESPNREVGPPAEADRGLSGEGNKERSLYSGTTALAAMRLNTCLVSEEKCLHFEQKLLQQVPPSASFVFKFSEQTKPQCNKNEIFARDRSNTRFYKHVLFAFPALFVGSSAVTYDL